ncbi:MAG: cation diffusion facilitator family transporter [Actinomycetota bacterium]|nr:cation diffusion facilitator family transporter [Actinomycetota bacterium]
MSTATSNLSLLRHTSEVTAHHHAPGGGEMTTTQMRRRLVYALMLSFGVLIVSIVGGLISGSLALLADAGHMLTDVTGLLISLIALTLAARPATLHRTFGLLRLEILAAAANSLLLFLVAGLIAFEAWQRWQQPSAIDGPLMLGFATIGLIANIVGMRLLSGGAKQSLNLKGAYLEMMGDLLGSIAVIAAALGIWLTGWDRIDPLASVAVALMILPRAWLLLKEALDILLETTPRSLNLSEVREHLMGQPNVVGVHDMHAWTITSGKEVMSAHVVVRTQQPAFDTSILLNDLQSCLVGHFNIAHSTLQIEPEGFVHPPSAVHE